MRVTGIWQRKRRQRQVLKLYSNRIGYTLRGIAELVGCSVSTVRRDLIAIENWRYFDFMLAAIEETHDIRERLKLRWRVLRELFDLLDSDLTQKMKIDALHKGTIKVPHDNGIKIDKFSTHSRTKPVNTLRDLRHHILQNLPDDKAFTEAQFIDNAKTLHISKEQAIAVFQKLVENGDLLPVPNGYMKRK